MALMLVILMTALHACPQLVQLVHLVMDVEVHVDAEMSQNVTL